MLCLLLPIPGCSTQTLLFQYFFILRNGANGYYELLRDGMTRSFSLVMPHTEDVTYTVQGSIESDTEPASLVACSIVLITLGCLLFYPRELSTLPHKRPQHSTFYVI